MAAVEEKNKQEEEFYDFFGTESHKKHDMAKIARRNSMEALGPEDEVGAREEFEALMLASNRRAWRPRRNKLANLGPEAEAGARRSMEAFFMAHQHLVGECADIEAEYLAEVQLRHDEIFDGLDCPIRRASKLRAAFESAGAGEFYGDGNSSKRRHPFSWSGPSAGIGGVGPLMRPTARLHPANRERFRSAGLLLSDPVRRARTASSAAAVLAVLTDEEAHGSPSRKQHKSSEKQGQQPKKVAFPSSLGLGATTALAAAVFVAGAACGWWWQNDRTW